MKLKNIENRLAVVGALIVLVGVTFVLCLVLFLLWRVDNPRVERFRMALVDRFVPTMDWTFGPINTVSRMIKS